MKPAASRFTLLAIMALFILPLVLAWFVYTGSVQLQPDEFRNQGQLVIPPLPLDWDQVELEGHPAGGELMGQWVILLFPDSPCEAACAERAAQIRQVHRALGRHQERVSIALLSEQPFTRQSAELLLDVYPEFNLLTTRGADLGEWLGSARELTKSGEDTASFFLVDPLGNIMMSYNTEDAPGRLSKDLKTLMTWSKQDTR